MIQKGVRETLLCDECEDRFQKPEHYFANFWYRDNPVPSVRAGGYFKLEGLDYSRFKLFILSILWRGSVAGSAEFGGLSLGPHEARIGRMLLSGNMGAEADYPILGGLIVDSETGSRWDDAMLAPMSIRVAGHNAARMLFGGVSWTIITSSHGADLLSPLSLKEDGTLLMPVTSWQEYAHSSGLIELADRTDAPDLPRKFKFELHH